MNISKSISFSIILVSVSSVMEWTYLPITNTYLWWGVYSWTLYIFYLHAKVVGFNNILVNFFLLLVAISFFYGAFFMTENYWDWKQLISNLMVFLLPMAAYTFNDVFVIEPDGYYEIVLKDNTPFVKKFYPSNRLLKAGLVVSNISNKSVFIYNPTRNHIYIRSKAIIGEVE